MLTVYIADDSNEFEMIRETLSRIGLDHQNKNHRTHYNIKKGEIS